jgi:hypothetical protein
MKQAFPASNWWQGWQEWQEWRKNSKKKPGPSAVPVFRFFSGEDLKME